MLSESELVGWGVGICGGVVVDVFLLVGWVELLVGGFFGGV